jgi:high-affinity nickel permease
MQAATIARVNFEFLFEPLEHVDEAVTDLVTGAPLLTALLLALVLGLRHASDPDHLVAVTSLVARDDDGIRAATRVGAWWGAGHAATLVAVGLPLILLGSALPVWLETGAERLVGVIVVVLALRVLWKWTHGGYRAEEHAHGDVTHRHLSAGGPAHGHPTRSPQQAFSIGVVHGLAGTGAIVILLIAAMPGQVEAATALAVFAPMSVVSMAAMTAGYAWAFTRPPIAPVYRSFLIPVLGVFGLLFGFWYATG